MRRTLLTAAQPSGPITVGVAPASTSSSTAATSFYSAEGPATGTGTLTTATVNLGSTGTIRFFVVNAATLTVRSVSPNISATTGIKTYAVSLSVVAGDYIGVAVTSGSLAVQRTNSGGTAGFYTGNSAPSVGTSVSSYSHPSSTQQLYLQASS